MFIPPLSIIEHSNSTCSTHSSSSYTHWQRGNFTHFIPTFWHEHQYYPSIWYGNAGMPSCSDPRDIETRRVIPCVTNTYGDNSFPAPDLLPPVTDGWSCKLRSHNELLMPPIPHPLESNYLFTDVNDVSDKLSSSAICPGYKNQSECNSEVWTWIRCYGQRNQHDVHIQFAETNVLLGNIKLSESFKEQVKIVSRVNVSKVRYPPIKLIL